jgi:hypothetical protein
LETAKPAAGRGTWLGLDIFRRKKAALNNGLIESGTFATQAFSESRESPSNPMWKCIEQHPQTGGRPRNRI